jgi:addiction module RelE/StbE family toxin
MKIEFHRHFIKAYHKLSEKEQSAADDRIRLFSEDPFSPKLENHALTGKYQGYRSINITGDYRAVYINMDKEKILFVRIGTHSQLYG